MAYQKLLTKKGRERLASATPENQLKITHIAVGDGNGSYPDLNENMTKLTNERYRSQVSAPMRDTQDKTILEFEGLIPANIGGFFVREVALFDDTNTMIAIAQTSEVEKPQATEAGTSLTLTLGFRMQLENEGQVNLIFKDSGYIDHAGLTGRDKADSHPITAITGLDGALNNKADKLTRINAGVGLEGGGTLESNRTLRVLLDSSLTSTAMDRAATPKAISDLNKSKQDNLTFVGNGPRTMREGAYGLGAGVLHTGDGSTQDLQELLGDKTTLYVNNHDPNFNLHAYGIQFVNGRDARYKGYLSCGWTPGSNSITFQTISPTIAKTVEILTDRNTIEDSKGVLHAGTSTPIDTLNTSDMAQDVINNDTMTVTSGAVYRALGNNQNLEYIGTGKIIKEEGHGIGSSTPATIDVNYLDHVKTGFSANFGALPTMPKSSKSGVVFKRGWSITQLLYATINNDLYMTTIWGDRPDKTIKFYGDTNTSKDKNGVLHAGTGTPLNTLNTSDLTDHVQAGLIAPVTSSGVYGALTPKADISFVNTELGKKADKTIQIIAGNGMSGGGTLAGNRTITLGNVSETSITSTNSVTSGGHSHALSSGVKASLAKADNSLQKGNNLSDVPNKTTARNNLGVTTELNKKRDKTDAIFEKSNYAEIRLKSTSVSGTGNQIIFENDSGNLTITTADENNMGSDQTLVTFPRKTGTVALEQEMFGVGQKWVDVTSQREKDEIYTNTTNKIILVNISGRTPPNTGDSRAEFFVDDVLVGRIGDGTSTISLAINPGSKYKFTGNQLYNQSWSEYR